MRTKLAAAALLALAQPVVAGELGERIALEINGVLDGAGVGVRVSPEGVGAQVQTPAGNVGVTVAPTTSAPPPAPSTPSVPQNDAARVLLDRFGESGLRDAIRSISNADRLRLSARLRCTDVLAHPERYAQAVVVICGIVVAGIEPTGD